MQLTALFFFKYRLQFIVLFNSLPNNKSQDWSKLKAFANKRAEIMIFVFDRVENIVGKGEDAFSPFSHKVFKRLFSGSLKGG